MRRIEDFMNWLTDMDWGWWPFLFLRPQKDQEMDNRILLKMAACYGTAVAFLIIFFGSGYDFIKLIENHVLSVKVLACCEIYGVLTFFVIYKSTFAYFWNRRARRLARGESSQASEV